MSRDFRYIPDGEPMTSTAPDRRKTCPVWEGTHSFTCTREPGHTGLLEAGISDTEKIAEWGDDE